jgi:hypothetical protein
MVPVDTSPKRYNLLILLNSIAVDIATFIFYLLSSHGIHKTPLNLIEHHNAQCQQNNNKHETINQPTPTNELTTTEEAVLERLNDGRHGVETHQLMNGDAMPELALGYG